MLNRLQLSIRPNNQLTLTYGNYRHVREVYKSLGNLRASMDAKGKARLQKNLDRIRREKEPKFDWEGKPLKKSKRPKSFPLVIIKKSQRIAKTCKLNKPKSFTAISGQRLRECGAAIDHICGDPQKTVAITLTLPAHHEAAFRALAAYSGYAVNRLFQPIRRDYSEKVLWFFVWEYQKRGALHLHIALYHPDAGKALEIGKSFREQWHKILQDIGKKAECDMFAGRNGRRNDDINKMHFYCQPMRRSLGAYFSKYAGKKESKQAWYCRKYPVSRFWGSSYALKKIVKSLSFDFVLELDDGDHISYIVNLILERVASFDMDLQSTYHFNISKSYGKNGKICFASGERSTFYCHPKKIRDILVAFSDIKGLF